MKIQIFSRWRYCHNFDQIWDFDPFLSENETFFGILAHCVSHHLNFHVDCWHERICLWHKYLSSHRSKSKSKSNASSSLNSKVSKSRDKIQLALKKRFSNACMALMDAWMKNMREPKSVRLTAAELGSAAAIKLSLFPFTTT